MPRVRKHVIALWGWQLYMSYLPFSKMAAKIHPIIMKFFNFVLWAYHVELFLVIPTVFLFVP